MDHEKENQPVKWFPKNLTVALSLAAIGGAFGAAGIYVGDTDDAPGAALLGIAVMMGAFVFAVRIALHKLQPAREKGLLDSRTNAPVRRGSS